MARTDTVYTLTFATSQPLSTFQRAFAALAVDAALESIPYKDWANFSDLPEYTTDVTVDITGRPNCVDAAGSVIDDAPTSTSAPFFHIDYDFEFGSSQPLSEAQLFHVVVSLNTALNRLPVVRPSDMIQHISSASSTSRIRRPS